MKYITFSLGLSTASLPAIVWSLRNTLEHHAEGLDPSVRVELENLADELQATQQRVAAEGPSS